MATQQKKRSLVATWAILAVCVAASVAPAQGAAAPTAEDVRAAKLTELWENLIHYIRIGQHEAATSFGQALLAFGAKPSEVYYLSARSPGSLATLAQGAG